MESDAILKELRSLRREVSQLRDIISVNVKDEYLNLNQACKAMGISSTKMYQMLSNGELPFATKLGKKWRFSKNALNRFLSNS